MPLDSSVIGHHDRHTPFASAMAHFSPRRVLSIAIAALTCFAACPAFASEADLAIPALTNGHFDIFGAKITAWQLLFYGSFVICGTLGISLYQFFQIKKQPAHQSMLNIAEIIYQTCQTYLIQ